MLKKKKKKRRQKEFSFEEVQKEFPKKLKSWKKPKKKQNKNEFKKE